MRDGREKRDRGRKRQMICIEKDKCSFYLFNETRRRGNLETRGSILNEKVYEKKGKVSILKKGERMKEMRVNYITRQRV